MSRLRRLTTEAGQESGDRAMLLYTTLMLILVSFFVVLMSRANFDETKYASAVKSLHKSFGYLPGGRVATGAEEGLPDQSRGFDQGGQLVLPDMEMSQIRALLAPAVLTREVSIIHTQNKRIISLSAGLVFNFDSADIKPEMAEILSSFAAIVADSPVTVAIEAHTDNRPPQTSGVGDNWDISGRRALAVLAYLTGPGGLAPERLTAFGYAGAKPLHSNLTPAGRAKNNRVDLTLDFSRARARDLARMAEKATTYEFSGFDFLLPGRGGEGRP
ncbi:MAG: OmpA family protein [Candidatus Adiutrix sp.]|nr:OmpA family protein [Candidatus Adiutrix sp.]